MSKIKKHTLEYKEGDCSAFDPEISQIFRDTLAKYDSADLRLWFSKQIQHKFDRKATKIHARRICELILESGREDKKLKKQLNCLSNNGSILSERGYKYADYDEIQRVLQKVTDRFLLKYLGFADTVKVKLGQRSTGINKTKNGRYYISLNLKEFRKFLTLLAANFHEVIHWIDFEYPHKSIMGAQKCYVAYSAYGYGQLHDINLSEKTYKYIERYIVRNLHGIARNTKNR